MTWIDSYNEVDVQLSVLLAWDDPRRWIDELYGGCRTYSCSALQVCLCPDSEVHLYWHCNYSKIGPLVTVVIPMQAVLYVLYGRIDSLAGLE